ncbi:hypothetical protein M2372_000710 [Chryseobacterium sp. BIGb0232]|nr:hypothetical protein [Chryseobacterium sp. BIGb0232]ROS19861.1 hypothetical protein EDF65_0559 [Chryseobacterium nakagawai]
MVFTVLYTTIYTQIYQNIATKYTCLSALFFLMRTIVWFFIIIFFLELYYFEEAFLIDLKFEQLWKNHSGKGIFPGDSSKYENQFAIMMSIAFQ